MSIQMLLDFDYQQLKQPVFPQTRFQGSKQKLEAWIWESVKEIEFKSVLDAFGGTGCVSHLMKRHRKQIYYNDLLRCNYLIGLGLIENDEVTLSENDLDILLNQHQTIHYPTFIQDTFRDIYFTDDENRWLDMIVINIKLLENTYKQAIAFFALFQACIIKRPYNLFHRKNLYVRFAEVERSFGNKTTWDKPFPESFKKFVEEANKAVFSNGKRNIAWNKDIFEVEGRFDLVYIDPPYVNQQGVGVDYLDFYHFLEGLSDYESWPARIDYHSKHRKFYHQPSVWVNRNTIGQAFDHLFKKFEDSILVVSYRSDGIPSGEEIMEILRKYKKNVYQANHAEYQYVLSTRTCRELSCIGI